ncbi:MAG: efflux RND transporter permease subunit [Rhodospirillaceae bacterium]|nr:efflux RND transporter permease subunit [Rhodospirillaceae bacterium]
MNAIIDAALSRSRMVISGFIVLFLVGTVSYVEIPKEAEPEITFPLIFVSLMLDGVSPGDAERLLIRPVEEEVQALAGIKEVRATGYQGGASITLEFEIETDLQDALADTRAAVDRAKTELPVDAEEPSVREFDSSGFPILSVTVSGPLPERTLLQLSRDLRDRAAQIGNVLEATISGVREEQVEIVIDPLMVEHYGLNNTELFQLFSRSNRLVAAGSLDTGQGRFAVTLPGLFEDIDDILTLPVKADANGTVRFSDIGEVRRTFKDPTTLVRVNGNPAVTVDIKNRRGTNIFNTAEQVRAMIARETKDWPEAAEVRFITDRSVNVRAQLDSIQNGVVLAIFLVMTLCMALLGVRSGLLVGASIPGAFLTGIFFMYMLGMAINFVAIFGLILSVGLLVDGAIVVVENADRRIAAGQKPSIAYKAAAKRMAWPIITSTGTTMAAFVPLLFWPGFVGQFMGQLPLTIILVLTASVTMALIFVPTIGSATRRKDSGFETVSDEAGLVNPETETGISGAYVTLLKGALAHPGKVILTTFAMLFIVPGIYMKFGPGITLNPSEEPRAAMLAIKALGNLSIEEQDRLVGEVEIRILDIGDFEHVYVRTGKPPGSGTSDADLIGEIRLIFKRWGGRRPADDVLAEVTRRTSDIAGVKIEAKKQLHMTSDIAVELVVSSKDPLALNAAALQIRQVFDKVDGLRNVDDTLPPPGIEWQLSVDRSEAAKYGVDITLVGESIRLITNGLRLGTYRPDDSEDEIDIVVRYPADYRTVRQLDDVRIETQQGLIPISNFVRRDPVQKIAEIERTDARRTVTLTAGVLPGVLTNEKVKIIKEEIEKLDLGRDVDLTFKGEELDSQENSNFLVTAFSMAMFLMAMILLAEFNSFYAVALILSSVILSTIGVFLGLLITSNPFIITQSGVGIIALAGIVVNNNIVLLDTFFLFRKNALSTYDAILRTGIERLRPVFLTTATTVLGLVPMALQIGVDFFDRSIELGSPALQFWRHLATAIVFGLIFATVLTLIVTPAALMAQHNFLTWYRSLVNKNNPSSDGTSLTAAE